MADRGVSPTNRSEKAGFGGAPGPFSHTGSVRKYIVQRLLSSFQKFVFLCPSGLEKMRSTRVLWSVRYVASNMAAATDRAHPSSEGQARLSVRTASAVSRESHQSRVQLLQEAVPGAIRRWLSSQETLGPSPQNVDLAPRNRLRWRLRVRERSFRRAVH